ncbi:hypothetical protein K435DRAFT_61922 [Dendrothele bispora CBS 962.96]|uniref:Uncharacterized protein n=1 Tax=Dendrothele bispora (strain CBS 962.96) TaxID=1314807 RepID=A0A4S8MT41_DENBC|nr:hypothetical protein K435DRAFT_61922 [Dendrothele bispora CBS 962.96]
MFLIVATTLEITHPSLDFVQVVNSCAAHLTGIYLMSTILFVARSHSRLVVRRLNTQSAIRSVDGLSNTELGFTAARFAGQESTVETVT